VLIPLDLCQVGEEALLALWTDQCRAVFILFLSLFFLLFKFSLGCLFESCELIHFVLLLQFLLGFYRPGLSCIEAIDSRDRESSLLNRVQHALKQAASALSRFKEHF
jgi:hypothetical protein